MKRFLILGIIFMIAFMFPIKTLAVDYEIDELTIQAEIKQNGVIHVYETHTYSFQSTFNGFTRTLYPKAGSYINNFIAFEQGQELKVELEDHTFYIHRKGESGEVVTINSFYIIHNGMELYEDVAQFYWPFIDRRNESTYENLEILIYPPEESEVIDFIGYDEMESTGEVLDHAVVKFSPGKVKAERNGDIRILYESDPFTSQSLSSDQQMKEKLTSAIIKDREKQEKSRERKNRLKQISPILNSVIASIIALLLISIWLKRRLILSALERRYDPSPFIPEERVSLPAMILFVTKTKQAFSQLLNVAFLDLVRRKLVKQIDSQSFTLVSKDTPYEHEVYLIDWMFNQIGDKGTLHIDQLKKYVEKEENAIKFQQDIKHWSNLIQLEISKNELEEILPFPRVGAIILEIFLPIFVLVFGINEMFGAMTILILLNVIAGLIMIFYRPKTVKGMMIQKDWNQFVDKYVYKLDMHMNQLTDDERARAYLYSFAINQPEVDQRNESLIKGIDLSRISRLDPAYFLIFTREAEQYFRDAYETSRIYYMRSSSSSAGRGGVGGGGGGSGAF